MDIAEFIVKFPMRPPGKPPGNADELRKLSEVDGVRKLNDEPVVVAAANRRIPEKSSDPCCHLWVIDSSGIPFILERASVIPPLESGKVKHTNLTGGGMAACAGEIWFDPTEQNLVYINGCSGRYGPRSAAELDAAVSVIAKSGRQVVSFGWETEQNKPARVLRR